MSWVFFSGAAGQPLYRSFRSTHQRQWDYQQFENEGGAEPVMGDQSKKLKPPRPPQPKSVSTPESQEVKEGVLIDLTELTLTNKATSKKEDNVNNNTEPMSLLDSSIAEKYQYLPAPLGEDGPDDPFEIKPSLKRLFPDQTFEEVFEKSSMTSSYSSAAYSSQTSSSLQRTTQSSGTSPAHQRIPLQPSQINSSVSQEKTVVTSGDRTLAYEAARLAIQKDLTPAFPEQRAPSQAPPTYPKPAIKPTSILPSTTDSSNCNLDTYITTEANPTYVSDDEFENNNSWEDWEDWDESPSAPPLPPRIYANLPFETTMKGVKPLPKIPQKPNPELLKSGQNAQAPSQKYYSVPPVSTPSPEKSSADPQWSKCHHDMTLGMSAMDGSIYENSSQTYVAGSMTTSSQASTMTWMSGLTKSDQNLTSTNEYSPQNKAALQAWDHKQLLGQSPQHSGEFDNVKQGARPKLNNLSSSMNASLSQPSTPNALPLPPKNTPSKPSLYSNVPAEAPRIHPIMKDGQQLSWTHYWLLPGKTAPTAQVKPFVNESPVDGSQRMLTRRGSDSCVYQNVGEVNPAGGMSASWFPEQTRRSEASVTLPSKTNQPGHVALPTTRHTPPPSDLSTHRDQIRQVQSKVHGVTVEEATAALASNHWHVEAAVRYLKLEQLFRIGVASRDKCRNLLETFQWNLEMAGSALLDELSTGSAV